MAAERKTHGGPDWDWWRLPATEARLEAVCTTLRAQFPGVRV